METNGFWDLARTLFIILIVIFAIIILINIVVLSRTDRLQTDATASFNFLLITAFSMSIDFFANIFFWYMFGMCAWWFVFFKMQERVYCLLPAIDSYEVNYHPYDAMLISLTVFKFFSLFKKILFD